MPALARARSPPIVIPLAVSTATCGVNPVRFRNEKSCLGVSTAPAGASLTTRLFVPPFVSILTSMPVCGLCLAMSTLPREKHNLHENCYGDYCSYIAYLAARSSVPMGISLKTWAKPSNQLCDKLCPAAGRAFRTRALIAARSLEVP